jgi:hypothetical protein
MPTLKREIFLRPTRFAQRFGEFDDPLQIGSEQTFDMKAPKGIQQTNLNGKGKFNSQTHGLEVNLPVFSPINKFKGGKASFSGPKMDVADGYGSPVPASTEPRRTQGPNWLAENKRTGGKKPRGGTGE